MLKVDGKSADKREILKDKEWRPFKQTFVVYAKLMLEDFEIETYTGKVVGKAGDYLVMGPRGNKWVQEKDQFEKKFEIL